MQLSSRCCWCSRRCFSASSQPSVDNALAPMITPPATPPVSTPAPSTSTVLRATWMRRNQASMRPGALALASGLPCINCGYSSFASRTASGRAGLRTDM
ncbi:hypothetical protein D3C72_1468430 [compost metagenome]